MCVIGTVQVVGRSSSVSVLYVVCLHMIFSKAALQRRGFHGTHGTLSGSATVLALGMPILTRRYFSPNVYVIAFQLCSYYANAKGSSQWSTYNINVAN